MTAMHPDSPTLVFVYNADSGLFNTLTDMAHKMFSPDTYACKLCQITYGNFHMRQEWKDFIESLDIPMEFLHRDELADSYGFSDLPLPAILQREGQSLKTLIDAAAINACESIDDLKTLLTARLAAPA